MTSLSENLSPHIDGHFTVLILDNEVTVDAFVADPPLPWIRLVYGDGAYGLANGYPRPLTADQARLEGRLWDHVSGLGIIRCLNELGAGIDMVVFGNNAGQGLTLAETLPEAVRAERGAVIYAEYLPQEAEYERLGYRAMLRRGDVLSDAAARAAASGKPLALVFLNTIQHDESNYHPA